MHLNAFKYTIVYMKVQCKVMERDDYIDLVVLFQPITSVNCPMYNIHWPTLYL